MCVCCDGGYIEEPLDGALHKLWDTKGFARGAAVRAVVIAFISYQMLKKNYDSDVG